MEVFGESWFQCRAKYEKIDEQTGREVKVNATYLVAAVSVTDADAVLTKMLEMITHAFIIKGCTQVNYEAVINNEDFDDWYKCRAMVTSIDERAGKEKLIPITFLVKGHNANSALIEADAWLEKGCYESKVVGISLSNIHEVSTFFLDGKV